MIAGLEQMGIDFGMNIWCLRPKRIKSIDPLL